MKTPTPTLAALIAEHPFTRTFSREHIELMAEGAAETVFQPNEVIFCQGCPANRFHLIVEGTVGLESHEPARPNVLLQKLGPGEVLGWSWLFPPFIWQFQARALDRCRLIVLDGAHLLVASNRDHEFGYQLLLRISQVVIHRLQLARGQLLEVSAAGISATPSSAPERK